MKLPKAILATVAGVFAIGGAFADPDFDYVEKNGQVIPIDERLDCTVLDMYLTCLFICPDGKKAQVFDKLDPYGLPICPKYKLPH